MELMIRSPLIFNGKNDRDREALVKIVGGNKSLSFRDAFNLMDDQRLALFTIHGEEFEDGERMEGYVMYNPDSSIGMTVLDPKGVGHRDQEGLSKIRETLGKICCELKNTKTINMTVGNLTNIVVKISADLLAKKEEEQSMSNGAERTAIDILEDIEKAGGLNVLRIDTTDDEPFTITEVENVSSPLAVRSFDENRMDFQEIMLTAADFRANLDVWFPKEQKQEMANEAEMTNEAPTVDTSRGMKI